ncbi:response regulator [Metalysinibacillus jejuensis]|uniref:response regulator n=1 Tax=Metalysinibacillus jejuensis TaxID=914327 RepID=UPI000D3A61C1|nr:response regulator transcription factor [Metalysinibacillus jejuensis]
MKILIVDDHLLIRKGVRLLLERVAYITAIYEADSGTAAITYAQKYQPDVVLLDLSMPGGLDGFTTARNIKANLPQVKIIVLTMHDEEVYIQQALQQNIEGYLLKNSEGNEVAEAIETVMCGERYYRTPLSAEQLAKLKSPTTRSVLTPREKEVLRLVALGYTNIQIGEQLSISTKTVERHKANMMHKLALKESHELVQYGIKNDYLSLN